MKETYKFVVELTLSKYFPQSSQILSSRLSCNLYEVLVDEGIEIPIVESKDMSYE